MKNNKWSPHKKSLSQARCWSPEGKALRVENRDWASKPPVHKNFISKNDEMRKAVFSYTNLKSITH